MALRLTPLTPARLDAEQRALYDDVVGGRRVGAHRGVGGLTAADGSLVGPFDSYLRSPVIGARLAALGEALRFDTALPAPLRELAILVVARHTTAQYEWFAHARIAAEVGVADDVIAAIARREVPALAGDEGLVYRAATQLVSVVGLDDSTYSELLDRFDERGTFELVALVGFYGTVSTILNAFDVPIPPASTPLD